MFQNKKETALLSIFSNAFLVLLKVIVGLFIGSVSVISEAIHSAIDLLAAVIAFFAVRSSDKPPDVKHPFGHGKYENISGTFEAILIFVAAGWIIFESVKKLLNPEPVSLPFWGILVMMISATVNFFVSKQLYKVGKKTDSIALQADGLHLKTDVLTSAGVAGGLALLWAGSFLFPDKNLLWLDPLIAIIVALFIIKEAWHLTKEATGGLLDESLNEELEKKIIDIINSFKPTIFSFHNFKTRKAGSSHFIEFHLMVKADMTVKESHDIADNMNAEIKKLLNEASIIIHIEPCEDIRCKEKCQKNCYLKKENLKHG